MATQLGNLEDLRSADEIEFREAGFRVGNRTVLAGVNMSVRHGEVLVLLGKSGSGKTTALKLINRLHQESAGEVRVGGRATREWNVIALRRTIGYVVQEVGLFPHYTVEKNVGLIPTLQRWPAERIDQRISEMLTMVDLDPRDFRKRLPHQLSGGQRQRVAVARALAGDPPILLMDEPFGALDPISRSELQLQFKRLQLQLQKTVVLVTHDLSEALLLGTRIALLDSGRLVGTFSGPELFRSSDPVAAAYVSAYQAGQQGLIDNLKERR